MKKLVVILSILHIFTINTIAQDCNTPENWTIMKDTMPNFSKQHDLYFASENVGYSTGVRGTMRKTIDGGKTWDILHGLEGMGTRAIMKSLYFVNELVGFAAGDGDFDPFNNVDNDAEFLRTIDGGLTWEMNFVDSMERVNDLKFFDDQHGLAICYANNKSNPILETYDAGKTWTALDTDIRRAEDSKFITAGERALVYGEDKLEFGSYILFEIKEDGTIDYSLTTPPGKSRFYFYNENLGFARTLDKGFKTIDGGITWTEINFPQTDLWSIIHFANEKNGIVANTIYEADTSGWEVWWYPSGIELFVTKDGANTWERYESGEYCKIEGRLNHSSIKEEIHFLGGNLNGTIIFNFKTNVKENLNEIAIYPNPVIDNIYLNSQEQRLIQAQIFNVAGQKVYEEKVSARINTASLKSGYYILKLFVHGKQINYPFVKQ